MSGDGKKNPHRNNYRIPTNLDDLLVPEREGLPKRTPRGDVARIFEEYAFEFNREFPPGHPIDFLRWSTWRMDQVVPWLHRAAKALNPIIGTILEIEGYNAIDAKTVLRYIVRHWRMFQQQSRSKFEHPVPEAIAALCKFAPNIMLDVLIGCFGKTLQQEFEKRSREVRQLIPTDDESARQIDEKRRRLYDAQKRLMVQVPWLERDDFLELISGERFGKRDLTMH
jgi:hypothetical protein